MNYAQEIFRKHHLSLHKMRNISPIDCLTFLTGYSNYFDGGYDSSGTIASLTMYKHILDIITVIDL